MLKCSVREVVQKLMNHFQVKVLFGFKLGIFGVELEEETEATLEERSILTMSLSLIDKKHSFLCWQLPFKG